MPLLILTFTQLWSVESGATTRKGPFTSFAIKWASSAIHYGNIREKIKGEGKQSKKECPEANISRNLPACIVFPNPISSPRIPFRPLRKREASHSTPVDVYNINRVRTYGPQT